MITHDYSKAPDFVLDGRMDPASRFGNFETFFSTGPKAAKSVGLNFLDDRPILVVERIWIERDLTEVDALEPIVEIHATDAARNRLRYPPTAVNDSRVTEARIIGKLRSSLIEPLLLWISLRQLKTGHDLS